MKAIVFEFEDWQKNYWPRIQADYGLGVNVSRVCRQRLGFTVRRHTDYLRFNQDFDMYIKNPMRIHLDFYDEASYTMFLLKYK